MSRVSGFVSVAAAVLLAVSCTSGGGSGASQPGPIVVLDEREAALYEAIGERVISDDLTVTSAIAASPDQVYRALVVAYSELGLPATVINPTTGLVASTARRMSVRLRDTRLSRYLSCGETMTGPRADQDRVVLSLVSRAKPDGSGGTRLETTLVATATDVGGTNTRLPCTTTGELESRMHRSVKTALGL